MLISSLPSPKSVQRLLPNFIRGTILSELEYEQYPFLFGLLHEKQGKSERKMVALNEPLCMKARTTPAKSSTELSLVRQKKGHRSPCKYEDVQGIHVKNPFSFPD